MGSEECQGEVPEGNGEASRDEGSPEGPLKIDIITRAVEQFEIAVRHGIFRGTIEVEELLDLYRAMRPSLHPRAREPDLIDFGALDYAIHRLPRNITEVREIFVRRHVPSDFTRRTGVTPVATRSRRRSAYRVGDGELVIVAREGVTEILDLFSLLCIWAVEAEKIARKVREADLAPLLEELAGRDDLSPEEENRALIQITFALDADEGVLTHLGESWSGRLYENVHRIVRDRGRVRVRIHSDIVEGASGRGEYASQATRWSQRIVEAVRERGLEDRPIHVLSSNTHSTVNVLSPFPREKRETIADWAWEHRTEQEYAFLREKELLDWDATYFVMRDWLRAFPDEQGVKEEIEDRHGFVLIEDRQFTGIDCQVIDLARVDPARADPRARLDWDRVAEERPVIINFDYAFGEQAEHVLEALFLAFGQAIRSVSIMGKAGTVVGERGGVMIPSYLLKEGSEDIYDFPVPNVLSASDVEAILAPVLERLEREREGSVRLVHDDGPMLTVLGTAFQNRKMLLDYKENWGILGLEMEGIPYVKKLNQVAKMGLLRDDAVVCVAYYASDAPLNPHETLSKRLRFEGVAGTYGINLAILNRLLG